MRPNHIHSKIKTLPLKMKIGREMSGEKNN